MPPEFLGAGPAGLRPDSTICLVSQRSQQIATGQSRQSLYSVTHENPGSIRHLFFIESLSSDSTRSRSSGVLPSGKVLKNPYIIALTSGGIQIVYGLR